MLSRILGSRYRLYANRLHSVQPGEFGSWIWRGSERVSSTLVASEFLKMFLSAGPAGCSEDTNINSCSDLFCTQRTTSIYFLSCFNIHYNTVEIELARSDHFSLD